MTLVAMVVIAAGVVLVIAAIRGSLPDLLNALKGAAGSATGAARRLGA